MIRAILEGSISVSDILLEKKPDKKKKHNFGSTLKKAGKAVGNVALKGAALAGATAVAHGTKRGVDRYVFKDK